MKQSDKNTQDVNLTRELKLPSANVVTADNLWQVVQAIAITSNKFTQEQLKSNGKTLPPPNTMVRILAYLKYLNFLSESREEETQGGKKVKIQYFIVNKENTLVAEVQYEIKAGRKEIAQEKWNQLLREHDITRIITKDFFATDSTKTRIDLENFLKERKELKGKNPSYYQHGVTFIIKLLGQAGILLSSGNSISCKVEVNPQDKDEKELTEETVNSDEQVPDQPSYTGYKVTISGPGLNTSIDIMEEFDIEIVEKNIEKIKNKISMSKNNKPLDENLESSS